MDAKLPNLELLAYKAARYLINDKKFIEKYTDRTKMSPFCGSPLVAKMFLQSWGNTCTGFDVTNNGEPTWGGSAITEEYTTVFCEKITQTYVVFFGDRVCYMVFDPTPEFYEDYRNCSMVSLSESKRRY